MSSFRKPAWMLPLLMILLPDVDTPEPAVLPLVDFADGTAAEAWRPIHDGVMGGVSSGRSRPVEGAVRFEGEVSLENNGGFASFRIGVRLPDLSGQDGLRLRVRGDGATWKLSLRTDGAWDGVSWQAPFATGRGAFSTVDIAFEALVPAWHGRLVTDAPPFEAEAIRQVGLLIADGQAGPFTLDLASLAAWRAASSASTESAPGGRSAAQARTASLAGALDKGASATELVERMRWSERVLVVAAPGDLDPGASLQIGRLLASGSPLAARELRVVQLHGRRGGRVAGRTLPPDRVDALREAWDLPHDAWAVALVGKDGGVKARWSEPVDPEEVFALIDAMPMRRAEAAARRDG